MTVYDYDDSYISFQCRYINRLSDRQPTQMCNVLICLHYPSMFHTWTAQCVCDYGVSAGRSHEVKTVFRFSWYYFFALCHDA